MTLSREEGNKQFTAMVLNNLATLAVYRGDYARAAPLQEESLALRRAIGYTRGIAFSLCSLGEIAKGQGEDTRAVALL